MQVEDTRQIVEELKAVGCKPLVVKPQFCEVLVPAEWPITTDEELWEVVKRALDES